MVDCGSVGPVPLQGIMIVDLFIWYVGVQVGRSVGTVVQPLWLQPGGKSPGGGKIEPAGAGLHVLGPGVHSGRAGGAGGGGVQPGGLVGESMAIESQSELGTALQFVRVQSSYLPPWLPIFPVQPKDLHSWWALHAAKAVEKQVAGSQSANASCVGGLLQSQCPSAQGGPMQWPTK